MDGIPIGVLPVTDRGLHYGDGLFETILIRDGMPCLWGMHIERLASGARRLDLTVPPEALLRVEAARACAGIDRGILKLILTRGSGGRGYRAPAESRSRRLLLIDPSVTVEPGRPGAGVRVRICRTPVSVNRRLAGIKHLNRLDSVLARSEWDDPDIAEGLMSDEEGLVVGGTMTNLFIWDGIGLLTPSVVRCGIAGTVRAVVIQAARRAGIPCREGPVTRTHLETAVGLFLTNARIGVWPVAELGDRAFDLDRLPGDLLARVRRIAHTPGWTSP